MFNFKIKGRPHFNAKRTTVDGINFDSLTEAEYYKMLKMDPDVIHIDCHCFLTLAGGVRLNVDFIVYYKDSSVEVVEVKGGLIKPDFKRLRQLFDQTHPLAPMKVMQKKNKKWNQI